MFIVGRDGVLKCECLFWTRMMCGSANVYCGQGWCVEARMFIVGRVGVLKCECLLWARMIC